ncbi:hypothetical protein [Fibrella forsythiae]|uniref:Uncharacterized protein n=1 Tax=Fibrella forsythiae TaxID=2817061 RepID=A0ABS3JLI2_9BACT|nr:hypothetical protein [Fibrella forsythiae]MBO0950862.1 hypothetical protein [Fibrella forsythiae]
MRDKFLFVPARGVVLLAAADRQASISAVFTANKRSRKLLETNANEQLQADLIAIANAPAAIAAPDTRPATHAALHRYEVASLSRGVFSKLKSSLKTRWNRLEFVDVPPNNTEIEIWETFGGIRIKLGAIHLGQSRFVRIYPQPPGVVNDVYRRRTDTGANARHYIELPSLNAATNVFVRRYVIRGLSGKNSIELNGNIALTAAHTTPGAVVDEVHAISNVGVSNRRHNLVAGSLMTEKQHIISHARGWQKRYLSTGVGNKLPLSTRGTPFLSLFGNVVVDLAMIPADTIFDIHSPDSVLRNLQLDPTNVLTQGDGYPANDYNAEEYLALRDVLRTRELLIKNSIPVTALVFNQILPTILAIGFDSNKHSSALTTLLRSGRQLPFPRPVNIENTLNYRGFNNKRWFFGSYASPLDCTNAYNAAVAHYGVNATCMRLHQYSFNQPQGMLLT